MMMYGMGLFSLLFPAALLFTVGLIAFRIYKTRRRARIEDDPYGIGRKGKLEADIYRLARDNKGSITVSDVVVETGVPRQQAESLLESMVDGMHVRMEVTSEGNIRYEFPELLSNNPDHEAGSG